MTDEELCARIQKPVEGGTPGMPVPKIVCKDGFAMSVQADKWTYCEPRQNYGPWVAVEVGYPSEREEALMPFCEDPERPTDTVYGYVPVRVVVHVINKHGGALDESAAHLERGGAK